MAVHFALARNLQSDRMRSVSLPLFLAVGFYCLWARPRGCQRPDECEAFFAFSHGDQPKACHLVCSRRHSNRTFPLHLFRSSIRPIHHLALALYLAVFHRSLLRQALPGFALALTLATIVFLPEGLFFLRHPESFLKELKMYGCSIRLYTRVAQNRPLRLSASLRSVCSPFMAIRVGLTILQAGPCSTPSQRS